MLEPGPAAETAGVRRLIDTALTRQVDREQAAALFHITPWPGGALGRVHAVRAEGWALFGDPAEALSVPQAESLARYAKFDEPTFTVGVRSDPKHGRPVVHTDSGPRAVAPARFGQLLEAVGRRSETAVALWLDGGSPVDPRRATDWTRALAAELGSAVYLEVDGARAAELPEAAIEGFALFAPPGEAWPSVGWALKPPSSLWLRFDPDGGPVPATRLVRLPDQRLRTFLADAAWHGSGAHVVFAPAGELSAVVRRSAKLDEHGGLATAAFARSVRGIPQVSVNGVERDLTPTELAAVLAASSGTRQSTELRLVVFAAERADDAAGQAWVRRVASATQRTVYLASPETRARVREADKRRRRAA